VAAGALAIGLFSYRYLIPGAPALSPPILANAFTRYGVLTVHAGFAATALILGPWQFLARMRAGRPRVHRWIGRSYAICALIAGAAGLILAFGATTGLASGVEPRFRRPPALDDPQLCARLRRCHPADLSADRHFQPARR
jgi:hypothetical protein